MSSRLGSQIPEKKEKNFVQTFQKDLPEIFRSNISNKKNFKKSVQTFQKKSEMFERIRFRIEYFLVGYCVGENFVSPHLLLLPIVNGIPIKTSSRTVSLGMKTGETHDTMRGEVSQRHPGGGWGVRGPWHCEILVTGSGALFDSWSDYNIWVFGAFPSRQFSCSLKTGVSTYLESVVNSPVKQVTWNE